MKQTRDTRSRSPKAKKPRKTVLLRLDEGEFTALEEMAEKAERSRSNMARILYLRGLAGLKKTKRDKGKLWQADNHVPQNTK
ncbi:hypothetical protein EOU39_06415 [Salmonella enterica]|nr:hypothetical protein [Salmonella enterica]